MHLKGSILFLLFELFAVNSSILVWSNKPVQISPLLPFDDEDFENLATQMKVKKVHAFKVKLKHQNDQLPKNFQEVLGSFYSSYNPNGNIATAEAIELPLLEDCHGIDTSKIKQTTGTLTNLTDFLCVLDVTYSRSKREADEVNKSADSKEISPSFKGSVIYIGKTKNNQYALLYSTSPLKLEMKNVTWHLGRTDNGLITVDKRFNIPVIPMEGKGKVILRFGILWVNGYWYLQTAKVEIVGESANSSTYDLSTTQDIMAPARFSYHCHGQTVFANSSSGIKLTIYDLQVQLDATQTKFGDANDCVPFTTVPIWSGLFITGILCIGLMVAITALMNIKTMDKFDNQSTKNLGITVME